MTAATNGMPKPKPTPNPTRRASFEPPWFIELLAAGELAAGGEQEYDGIFGGDELGLLVNDELELGVEGEFEVGSNFTP